MFQAASALLFSQILTHGVAVEVSSENMLSAAQSLFTDLTQVSSVSQIPYSSFPLFRHFPYLHFHFLHFPPFFSIHLPFSFLSFPQSFHLHPFLPTPGGRATTIFLNLPFGQVAIKINLPKITLTCPNNNLFHIVHY